MPITAIALLAKPIKQKEASKLAANAPLQEKLAGDAKLKEPHNALFKRSRSTRCRSSPRHFGLSNGPKLVGNLGMNAVLKQKPSLL
jgi:hypothetical protein